MNKNLTKLIYLNKSGFKILKLKVQVNPFEVYLNIKNISKLTQENEMSIIENVMNQILEK